MRVIGSRLAGWCMAGVGIVLLASVPVACSGEDERPQTSKPATPTDPAGTASPDTVPGTGPDRPLTPQPTAVPASPPRPGTVRLGAVELRPEDPYAGGQLVVLINGSNQRVDVTCWVLRSAATGTSARIIPKGPLGPGTYLRLFPDDAVFESTDTLSLLDGRERLIDWTPKLDDHTGDDRLWFRTQSGTWSFGRDFRLPDQGADGRLVTDRDTC